MNGAMLPYTSISVLAYIPQSTMLVTIQEIRRRRRSQDIPVSLNTRLTLCES